LNSAETRIIWIYSHVTIIGFCAIKYEECDPEKGTFRISRDDSKYKMQTGNGSSYLMKHGCTITRRFLIFTEKAQTDGDCLNPKKAGSSDHILIPCGTTDGNKVTIVDIRNLKQRLLFQY
jgi:hypothetical protein